MYLLLSRLNSHSVVLLGVLFAIIYFYKLNHKLILIALINLHTVGNEVYSVLPECFILAVVKYI
jgi:hypothetical protein